jgi:hypothetical protein
MGTYTNDFWKGSIDHVSSCIKNGNAATKVKIIINRTVGEAKG